MISLGCAKNLVDAEIMLGSVLERGMQITPHADEADVLVVNTCAFIDSAKEESIDAILEAHQQRGLGKRPNQKLIVSGCMSQRFAEELRASLPEVDAFIGLDQVRELGAIIEQVVAGTVIPIAPANSPGPAGMTASRLQLRYRSPDLHSRLGYAALSADPSAQCLPEDRRGLQSSLQLLCHPADARPASQSFARFCPGGNAPSRRGGREGNQLHQPGHHLLRHGSVDGEGGTAAAGRFFAWPDAGGVVARDRDRSKAIFGCACFTRIRHIGVMS